VVFWIGIVLAGVGPSFLILIGFGEAGWAALISGVVMMLASRFEDILELTVGPVRAKLREKVQEADTTLAETRNLASLLTSTSLSLVKRSGQIGGYTDEEQNQIAQEFRDSLGKVGTDETKIDELFEDWPKLPKPWPEKPPDVEEPEE
jgi:hypothetical protein